MYNERADPSPRAFKQCRECFVKDFIRTSVADKLQYECQVCGKEITLRDQQPHWQRQKDVNSWAEGNESTQHEGCLAFTTVDVGKTIEINEALAATDKKFQTIKAESTQ